MCRGRAAQWAMRPCPVFTEGKIGQDCSDGGLPVAAVDESLRSHREHAPDPA
jgi:hypothetical protein